MSGQAAFEASREVERLRSAKSEEDLFEAPGRHPAARQVAGRIFHRSGPRWVQTGCPGAVLSEPGEARRLSVGSDAYFELLRRHPELAKVFALGGQVVFELDGRWYRIEG